MSHHSQRPSGLVIDGSLGLSEQGRGWGTMRPNSNTLQIPQEDSMCDCLLWNQKAAYTVFTSLSISSNYTQVGRRSAMTMDSGTCSENSIKCL